MAIARLSKSRGRNPLQVRVLHPPLRFALSYDGARILGGSHDPSTPSALSFFGFIVL